MQCPVCSEVRRQWNCPSCVTQQVRQKRALAAASWAAKEAVEQQVASQAERELARAEQSSQRERRRWKLAQMQADLEREQQQVQEARARVSTLRPFLLSQSARVAQARAQLQQYQVDFKGSSNPQETAVIMKQFEQLKQRSAAGKGVAAGSVRATAAAATAAAAAAAAMGSLAASSSDAIAVAAPAAASSSPLLPPSPSLLPPAAAAAVAISRSASVNWQRSPLYTRFLRRELHGVQEKLARRRYELLRALLSIVALRRKSPSSCSIAGLEVLDDPEEMFDAPLPPQVNPNVGGGGAGGSSISDLSPRHATPLTAQQQQLAYPPSSSVMDAEVVSASLGYLVLLLHILSVYLGVHLPYPLCFAGSRSHVRFLPDDTRYYLTLMDNSSTAHFRRALSLLNYDIEDAAYDFRAALGMTQMEDAASAGAAHGQRNGGSGGGNGSDGSWRPLHLLPNTLTLVETVSLALKRQMNEPYEEHEERMRRLQLEQKRLAEEHQRVIAAQQQGLFGTPQQRSPATTQHPRQLATAAGVGGKGTPVSPSNQPGTHALSPRVLDASVTQSMVQVLYPLVVQQQQQRQNVALIPPQHPSHMRVQIGSVGANGARPRAPQPNPKASTTSPTPHFSVAATSSAASPPYYPDQAMVAAASLLLPNLSPQSQTGAPSLDFGVPGSLSALPATPADSGPPSSSPLSSTSSSLASGPSSTGSNQSSSGGGGGHFGSSSGVEELLTPSTFFDLPPNGYMVTEEPRESVLLVRPTQDKFQQHAANNNRHANAQQLQQHQRKNSASTIQNAGIPPRQQQQPQQLPQPLQKTGVFSFAPAATTVMPSPPPPFHPVGVGASEVAMSAAVPSPAHSMRVQSSAIPAAHAQRHPPTAAPLSAAAAAAVAAAAVNHTSAVTTSANMPRFRPGPNAIVTDGHFAPPPSATPVKGLPASVPISAAAQFAALDPSHPLHPSHHMLQSPASPSAGGATAVSAASAVAAAASGGGNSSAGASFRSSSSPLDALGFASAAAQQAGAVLSTLGSHTSNWLLGAGESASSAVRQLQSPRKAVSYVSSEDPNWDVVDTIQEDDIDRPLEEQTAQQQHRRQMQQQQQQQQAHGLPHPPEQRHA